MGKWILDPAHSVAVFAVRHMGLAFVRGQLHGFSGSLYFDPPDIGTLQAQAEIDASTLFTGVEKRDAHLKSADFFDVEKFPRIVFKSTSAEPTGPNAGRLMGDITIRGLTMPVTLEFRYFGPVKAPLGEETSIGFSAQAVVRVADFGMTWNVPMPGGGMVVGPEAHLAIDVEADLAPE